MKPQPAHPTKSVQNYRLCIPTAAAAYFLYVCITNQYTPTQNLYNFDLITNAAWKLVCKGTVTRD